MMLAPVKKSVLIIAEGDCDCEERERERERERREAERRGSRQQLVLFLGDSHMSYTKTKSHRLTIHINFYNNYSLISLAPPTALCSPH